jgi:hypothetical protein
VGRPLFNLAVVVSLILCVATVGLWVRSHWFGIQFHRHHQHETGVSVVAIGAARGVLTLKRSFAPELYLGLTDSTAQSVDWDVPAQMRLKLFSESNEHGFFLAMQQRRIDRDSRTWLVSGVSFPLWLLTALLLVLPMTWIVRTLRRYANRRLIGLCDACGYDLRATPSRCPECGAVPSVK